MFRMRPSPRPLHAAVLAGGALLAALLAWGGLGAPPAAAQTPAPTAQPAARPLQALVGLGRATVSGRAAGSAELQLELRGAAQTLKGSASGNALPFLGFYNLSLADADGNPVSVAAGDRVKLNDAAGPSIEAQVPELRIAADAATDTVTGLAPAGAAISVTVSGGLGFDAQSLGAVADGRGVFAVSFAGRYDIVEGSNLRLDLPAGPFTFRLDLPLAATLNLRLFDAAVSGAGPNGASVAVALSRGGRQVAAGAGQAAFFGIFGFNLTNPAGEPQALLVGDLVNLNFQGLARHDLTVPLLDAQADAATDQVSGQAPAGAELQVTAGTGPGAVGQRVQAGADGRWRADFGGQADLAPGSSGQVQLLLRQPGLNVNLSRGWALTRLEAVLGENTVNGIGAPDAPATLVLRSASGTEKGRASAAPAAAGGAFQVTLVDPLDRAALILPGDRLAFRRGAESFELVIPKLTAEVDIGQDRISGEAPAGASLQVSARVLFNTQSQSVTVGADGRYQADFKGRLDIVGGSRVDVLYSYPEGHRVRLVEAASSIRVWPELGRVDGSIPGGTELTVVALDVLGIPKGTATGTASALGRYDLTLSDAAGQTYLPKPGDKVELRFEGLRRSMVVPALGIDWDTAAETVSGESETGGTVTVQAQPPEGQGNAAVTRAVPVPESAFYRADFKPDADLRAGSRLQLTYTYPNGNRLRVDRAIPWLNAQVGGDRVAGLALPRAAVQARLEQGTASRGSGRATAAVDQRFSMRLADEAGRPAPLAGGQTLGLSFGRALSRPVLPLALRLEQAADQSWDLSGTGPISRSLTLRLEGGGGARTVTVTTDRAGAWRRGLPAGVGAGPGLRAELSTLDEEGHRFYSVDLLARLTAYLGTERVLVEGRPLARARLSLEPAAGGAPLAGATEGLDTEGLLEARLSGAAARIKAGQALQLNLDPLDGGVARQARMTVADLTLALDTAGSLVTGKIPPPAGFQDRLVTLRLSPRSGAAPRNFTALADDQGVFRFNSANPGFLAGPGLPLGQVGLVELIHTGADGHRTVLAAVPRIAVFLPRLSLRQ